MINPHLLLLIDHMNIDFKRYNFNLILTTWLKNVLINTDLPKICDLKIRAYGVKWITKSRHFFDLV